MTPKDRLCKMAEYIEGLGLGGVATELTAIARELEEKPDAIRELSIIEYRAYHERIKWSDELGDTHPVAYAAKNSHWDAVTKLTDEIQRVLSD